MSKSNHTPWNGGFDLTDKTFGRLYVVRFLRVENRKKIWECKCVCGTVRTITTGALNAGIKSCGCLQRDAEDAASNTVEDFFSRYNKSDGCWEWKGKIEKGGYGRFLINGVNWMAHRFAWAVENGPIPKGMLVCHRCDNPPCVRVSHLFLGDTLNNVHDKMKKERENVKEGSRHANAKLTEDQVVEIRKRVSLEGYSSVAATYGVSYSVIRRIARNEGWIFRQAEKRTRVPLVPTKVED